MTEHSINLTKWQFKITVFNNIIILEFLRYFYKFRVYYKQSFNLVNFHISEIWLGMLPIEMSLYHFLKTCLLKQIYKSMIIQYFSFSLCYNVSQHLKSQFSTIYHQIKTMLEIFYKFSTFFTSVFVVFCVRKFLFEFFFNWVWEWTESNWVIIDYC